jgi:hypothetical protein
VAARESGSAGLAPAVRSFFECVSSIVTHYVMAHFVPPMWRGYVGGIWTRGHGDSFHRAKSTVSDVKKEICLLPSSGCLPSRALASLETAVVAVFQPPE